MKINALDQIRDRILSGQLHADTWIKQDLLAAELGVSKIPVREALRQLEHEGLVKAEINRGFFVRPLLPIEAEDIFELRLKLEPDAVLVAARSANLLEQKAARAAHKQLFDAIRAQSPDVAQKNRAFHLALVLPAKRLITADLIERLHILAERYVRVHLQPTNRSDRANREHREILDAWLDRDGAALKLTREHIAETLRDLRAELSAPEP
jgi:DNA-binding GntR family transcriptional regulator